MKQKRIVSSNETVNPEVYEKALRTGLKEKFPKWATVKAKKNFSPSKLGFGAGKCPRYWQYLFEGELEHEDIGDHKSQLKRLFGITAHEAVQDVLPEAEGWEYEVKVISNDPPVFGYVDIYDRANNVPVEIKNVPTAKFLEAKEMNRGDTGHVIQTLMYMKIMGAKQGVLLYIDRTTLDTHAFSVMLNDFHQAYIEGLFRWMQKVRAAFLAEEVVARPEGFTEKSFPCTYCPLRKHCWSDDREPTIQIMKAKDLEYK